MENEVRMALVAAKKALQRLVDDNPKSGVIVNRGEPSEGKIRNADAIKALDRIDRYFTDREERAWERCPRCRRNHAKV